MSKAHPRGTMNPAPNQGMGRRTEPRLRDDIRMIHMELDDLKERLRRLESHFETRWDGEQK